MDDKQEPENKGENSLKQEKDNVLVSYGGHHRATSVARGLGSDELMVICRQLYSDIAMPEKIFLRYFDDGWCQWIDITHTFKIDRRCKIEIVAEKEYALGAASASSSATATATPTDSDSPERKKKISELLKSLTGQGKKSSTSDMAHRKQKVMIKVQLGWMHYNKKTRNYSQVKAQCGGGTIHFGTARNTKYDEVLEKAVQTFFPSGQSKLHGSKDSMCFSMGNTRGQAIEKKDFDLETLFNEGGSRCKLYLLSKEKNVVEVSDSSDDDFPVFQLPPDLDDPFKLESVASTSTMDTGTPSVSFKPQSCGICADRRKDSFFIPCGHALCAPCAVFIEESDNKECPFCKNTVGKVGTLFE